MVDTEPTQEMAAAKADMDVKTAANTCGAVGAVSADKEKQSGTGGHSRMGVSRMSRDRDPGLEQDAVCSVRLPGKDEAQGP